MIIFIEKRFIVCFRSLPGLTVRMNIFKDLVTLIQRVGFRVA